MKRQSRCRWHGLSVALTVVASTLLGMPGCSSSGDGASSDAADLHRHPLDAGDVATDAADAATDAGGGTCTATGANTGASPLFYYTSLPAPRVLVLTWSAEDERLAEQIRAKGAADVTFAFVNLCDGCG